MYRHHWFTGMQQTVNSGAGETGVGTLPWSSSGKPAVAFLSCCAGKGLFMLTVNGWGCLLQHTFLWAMGGKSWRFYNEE